MDKKKGFHITITDYFSNKVIMDDDVQCIIGATSTTEGTCVISHINAALPEVLAAISGAREAIDETARCVSKNNSKIAKALVAAVSDFDDEDDEDYDDEGDEE